METCRRIKVEVIYEDMASHTDICVSVAVLVTCRHKNEEEIYEDMA